MKVILVELAEVLTRLGTYEIKSYLQIVSNLKVVLNFSIEMYIVFFYFFINLHSDCFGIVPGWYGDFCHVNFFHHSHTVVWILNIIKSMFWL